MKLTYSEQLKDPRWQRRRLEKMQQLDFKCEICGDNKEELNVHHARYRKDFMGRPLDPWEYSQEELQCLCHTCHSLAHVPKAKLMSYCTKNLPAVITKTTILENILPVEDGLVFRHLDDLAQREFLSLRERLRKELFNLKTVNHSELGGIITRSRERAQKQS